MSGFTYLLNKVIMSFMTDVINVAEILVIGQPANVIRCNSQPTDELLEQDRKELIVMIQECNHVKARETLWDIGELTIEKELPVQRKMEIFKNNVQEQSLTHLNKGYTVRVHFGNAGYSATDALKHYLKQIAQLKY